MKNKRSVQYCPSCDHEISSAEINISEGFALCENCDELSPISELNHSGSTREEILKNPPKRCTLVSDYDRIEMNVSLFSFMGFIGSLFFTLFWNGIVSIFVSLAIAAVYYHLVGPIPDWFPTPGIEDGQPIMNDKVMGVGRRWAFVYS